MKPWEETSWEAVEIRSGGIIEYELHHGEGLPHCLSWGSVRLDDPDVDSESAELSGRVKLAAAAPEMARLLLAREWEEFDEAFDYCPTCRALRRERASPPGEGHKPDCNLVAVLRKAGVLP